MAVPVNQGTINRLRQNLSFVDHPELNITPAFLGKGMIKVRPQGDITHIIPTATGFVTSPEPYLIVDIEVHLVRSMALASAFKTQWKKLSTLGDAVVRYDSTTYPDDTLTNVVIKNVGEVDQAGENADAIITMTGYMIVNSDLYGV
jgi:hypothetical protein